MPKTIYAFEVEAYMPDPKLTKSQALTQGSVIATLIVEAYSYNEAAHLTLQSVHEEGLFVSRLRLVDKKPLRRKKGT